MQADPLSQKALVILDKSLGSEHPALVPVLTTRAGILKKLGQAEEADRLETRAKAIKMKRGE
jgi:hypothetical protein